MDRLSFDRVAADRVAARQPLCYEGLRQRHRGSNPNPPTPGATAVAFFGGIGSDSLGAPHHFHAAQTQRAHDGARRRRDENRRNASGHQPPPIERDANNDHETAKRQKHPSIAEVVASEIKPTAPRRIDCFDRVRCRHLSLLGWSFGE
jgi:hypothetical protein